MGRDCSLGSNAKCRLVATERLREVGAWERKGEGRQREHGAWQRELKARDKEIRQGKETVLENAIEEWGEGRGRVDGNESP